MITPSFGLTATERVLPKLALDFTTAILDPRVTFTRTTGSSNPATYVNSSGYITTATNNQPRFDYNPVTLACNGLLIEESRANLVTYSEQFSGGAWAKNGLSASADTAIAPDGTLSADSLIEDSASTQKYAVATTISVTSGTTYSVSVFAKASANTSWFQIPLASGVFGANAWANFDLTNGVVGNKGSAATASIVNFGNGWFRCVISAPAAVTGPSGVIQIALTDNTDTATRLPTYQGDGTSGVYIWGAQVEADAFPTSYIPTTTTALTRNADVATMTGTNFSDWYNASEGAIKVIGATTAANATSNYSALTMSDGTTAYRIAFRLSNAAVNTNLQVVYNSVAVLNSIVADFSSAVKTCDIGYKLNDFACCRNGGTPVTSSSGSVPTLNRLYVGSNSIGSAEFLNGHVKAIYYWPQRLTNAELQAFSK